MSKELTPEERQRVQQFIDVEKNKRVLMHYLIPLAGVGVKNFGGLSNVDYALTNKQGDKVFVKCKKYNRAVDRLPSVAPSTYLYTIELSGHKFYVFDIMSRFVPDVLLMLSGQYTEITDLAKDTICALSGLAYNKKKGAFKESSPILQALYANSPLHSVLALYLEIPTQGLPTELVSPIAEDSTLYIENWVGE